MSAPVKIPSGGDHREGFAIFVRQARGLGDDGGKQGLQCIRGVRQVLFAEAQVPAGQRSLHHDGIRDGRVVLGPGPEDDLHRSQRGNDDNEAGANNGKLARHRRRQLGYPRAQEEEVGPTFHGRLNQGRCDRRRRS